MALLANGQAGPLAFCEITKHCRRKAGSALPGKFLWCNTSFFTGGCPQHPGTDLYLEEVGFGTGEYGNVFLYEYGVDPATYFEKSETNSVRKAFGAVRIPRNADAAKAIVSPRVSVEKAMQTLKQDGSDEHSVSYRALSTAASNELNVRPQSSPRLQGYTLTLPDSWLERIERYRAERQ